MGDLDSISGLGRSPGEGNNYLLQYSGLENPMDYTVAKSQTRLNDVHFHNIFSYIRMDIYLIMLSLMSKIAALEFLEKMLVHLNVHV